MWPPCWGQVVLFGQVRSIWQAEDTEDELLPKRKGSRRKSWVLLWLLFVFRCSFLASNDEARALLQDFTNIKQLCSHTHAHLYESPFVYVCVYFSLKSQWKHGLKIEEWEHWEQMPKLSFSTHSSTWFRTVCSNIFKWRYLLQNSHCSTWKASFLVFLSFHFS